MMKVFDAQHHVEAHFLQGLLEASGIGAVVRGESLFTTVEGASVLPGMQPSVWILEDGQLGQARRVLADYRTGSSPAASGEGPWQCPGCGEFHGPQFTSCWKCGTPVPGPGDPAD